MTEICSLVEATSTAAMHKLSETYWKNRFERNWPDTTLGRKKQRAVHTCFVFAIHKRDTPNIARDDRGCGSLL